MPAFRRFTLVLVPVALLLIAAVTPGPCRLIRGQSTPEDPSDDVSVCRTDVWIHENGQKLANLAGAGQGSYPTWDGTKPTASYQSGAGAATVTHWAPSLSDPNHTATSFITEGTVTGNVDNLAAVFYLSAPVDEHGFGAYYPHFQLTVDGQVIYEAGDANDYNVPLSSVSDGIVEMRFAFTGLYDVIGQPNDPEKEHTVRLLTRGWTYGDEAVFIYDTAEVPSGFVFNIEQNKLGSYTQFQVG